MSDVLRFNSTTAVTCDNSELCIKQNSPNFYGNITQINIYSILRVLEIDCKWLNIDKFLKFSRFAKSHSNLSFTNFENSNNKSKDPQLRIHFPLWDKCLEEEYVCPSVDSGHYISYTRTRAEQKVKKRVESCTGRRYLPYQCSRNDDLLFISITVSWCFRQ